MSSGLTVGFARRNLPTAALNDKRATSAATASPYFNAATAWLMSHGKWKGSVQAAAFAVQDNQQVTLPRGMLAILGCSIQGTGDAYRVTQRFPVLNEWFQWVPGGPGIITRPPYDVTGFAAQGDGFVLFRDLASASAITATTTTTESSAQVVNIRGYSGGAKVYTGTGAARIEGENVTLPTSAGPAITSTVWDAGNSIYGVTKPATNGVVTFTGSGNLIGSYEPGEQVPCYRRYLVPQRINSDGQLVAICKRRHVDVATDNDEIVPGNLTALEIALMAVDFRRKAEEDRAQKYIGMAIEELNSELGQFEAEESYGPMQIDPFVGMATVPNLV